MGNGTQYGIVGAQQTVNLRCKTYKEMTHKMDFICQSTKTAI